jgi:Ohr subfamily peroxiredoxin
MTVLYTAKVHVTSGRDGAVRSQDGLLSARLAFPTSLGGDGQGTNPEQLFAAGYAACFLSTLKLIGKSEGTPLTNAAIDAEVDMLNVDGTYDLGVRLSVRAEGADERTLLALIEKTKKACPYSRATFATVKTTIGVAK